MSNDFTKEELENLHWYTYMYHHNAGIIQPELFLDKLQSLIDNYCEHKNREPGYDEENGHHVYCTNCY